MRSVALLLAGAALFATRLSSQPNTSYAVYSQRIQRHADSAIVLANLEAQAIATFIKSEPPRFDAIGALGVRITERMRAKTNDFDVQEPPTGFERVHKQIVTALTELTSRNDRMSVLSGYMACVAENETGQACDGLARRVANYQRWMGDIGAIQSSTQDYLAARERLRVLLAERSVRLPELVLSSYSESRDRPGVESDADASNGRADVSKSRSRPEATPASLQARVDTMTRLMKEVVSRVPSAGFQRTALPDVAIPKDEDEYDATGGMSVLAVTAISRFSDDIPMKRVYAKIGDKSVTLARIRSIRSVQDTGLVESARFLGPYREDAAFLLPADVVQAGATIYVDFASKAVPFQMLTFGQKERDMLGSVRPINFREHVGTNASYLTLLRREFPSLVR